ncbi:DUF485 domain-containing protein [Burkholderia stagnalis]|uniref:DUF485 domain-containing protein n=1 Tax=Burkholderia stagnalis TaxID=1503054 RepID=UPI0007581923|nr:DUF485 domain-containing protein [Burkholderia stagnalis]
MELNASAVSRIRAHATFRELAARRARLSWSLIASVLGAYFALAACVAFRPGLLRAPVAAGHVTTVGVVAAIAVIVVGWAFTWLYVWRANGKFERLNDALLGEVTK